MEFDLVLRTFIEFFEREEIPYAVIGGVAVHAWGRLRSTKDIDFAVPLSDQKRIIAYAEQLGYETLNITSGYSNHVNADVRYGRVDFMYLDPTSAAGIFGAAVEKPLMENTTGMVASAEHLAMMKALAMKNFPHRALFEGDDVRVLLETPGVDRESVRDYFERQGLLELFNVIDKARRTS